MSVEPDEERTASSLPGGREQAAQERTPDGGAPDEREPETADGAADDGAAPTTGAEDEPSADGEADDTEDGRDASASGAEPEEGDEPDAEPEDGADPAAEPREGTDPDEGQAGSAGVAPDSADPGSEEPDSADLGSEEPDAAAAGPAASRRAGRRADRGRRVHWGRGIAGAALSIAVAGAVVGATLIELPTLSGDAGAVTVTPKAAPAVVSCTGPLLALGRDASAADQLSVAKKSSVTVGAAEGEPESSALPMKGVKGDADATRYELAGEGRRQASLAAADSAEVRDEDLSGYSASACRPAAMESWIVGGSTAVGHSDILLLANPGSVNATVALTVFGAAGEVDAPGEPIAIPAGSQVAVPLAGIAGGEESPTVRVTAEGAPVRAALQSSEVRTLDPVGVDVQGAVTPSDAQVFPGVAITEDAIEAEATPAIVRLLSRAGGAVTVTATPAGQSSPAKTLDLELEADTPVSAALDGLDAGRYTVEIRGADGPLVSAVWQTTGPGGEEDFAWQTPSPVVADPVTVAVPDGPLAQLYLVNDGDQAATVTVSGESETRISLAPGGSNSTHLASGSTYTISPDGDGAAVHAVVAFRDGGSLAALPVWPDAAASSDVTVYP